MKIIVLGVSYKKYYLQFTHSSQHFIFTDYVPATTLEILYKNAHLFLFPTLSEGFGASPLEAMKYGTLCACSANSAITEIFTDSVLYFNPDDDTEIGIRVLQSFDDGIRKEKREKMKQRYEEIREKQNSDLEELINTILQ
jgi:glycosyltransferase involved in cell wall biosynthesis